MNASTPTHDDANLTSGLNGLERTVIGAGIALTVLVLLLEFAFHASEVLIFALSAVTLVALAWLLGESTDQLGHAVGGRIAGLLNATVGNLPELIVVLLLINAATDENGFVEVAKASIIGSVLGNVLLVMGLAFFVGGLKHGTQRFTVRFASLHASMLVLAVAALAIPTAIHDLGRGEATKHIQGLSLAAAIVIFVLYVASVVFFMRDTEHVATEKGAARWSRRLSLPVMIGAAFGVAIVSEALVGSMEHTIQEIGISETFMGFILVPIVGNIAEHLVAVQLAYRNDMDFGMTIAIGSSVQVALGLVPAALVLSYALGNPIDLVFQPLQLLALTLAAVLVPILVSDGESTWIEGLQLLAIYALIAIGFWY